MRLEPVYLVAPRQTPPTMPSRRAFLLAGGAFVVGSAMGGACGYSLGVGSGGEVAPESSGDATLDELRRLAVKAPIEELVQQRMFFANTLVDHYRNDGILWDGTVRLAEALLRDPKFQDRRVFSRFLMQLIDNAPPTFAGKLKATRDALASVK